MEKIDNIIKRAVGKYFTDMVSKLKTIEDNTSYLFEHQRQLDEANELTNNEFADSLTMDLSDMEEKIMDSIDAIQRGNSSIRERDLTYGAGQVLYNVRTDLRSSHGITILKGVKITSFTFSHIADSGTVVSTTGNKYAASLCAESKEEAKQMAKEYFMTLSKQTLEAIENLK